MIVAARNGALPPQHPSEGLWGTFRRYEQSPQRHTQQARYVVNDPFPHSLSGCGIREGHPSTTATTTTFHTIMLEGQLAAQRVR
ncbi:hypothetical protein NJB1907Z4_P0110 (plasmid) [Mycobacterium pseudoshottsii]|uniref:Uncharacterized protein n=1 Tax=Mycobacterium pseudoshottsii TaxID=265949 RepID=A0A9N7QS84_9MYCO|nr:hypothetical protein NJB1907Z4_P0110 [Mycobacterium pseudoshottsii]